MLVSEWDLSLSLTKLDSIITCVAAGQTPYSRLLHSNAAADISLSKARPLSLDLETKM